MPNRIRKINDKQFLSLKFVLPNSSDSAGTTELHLDGDNLEAIIVCDSRSNTISWVRQYPQGTFTEPVLAEGLIAPAHVEAADFDKDGDQDLMLAVLGMLFPNNDKIGSVVILENNGDCTFNKHVVIEKVARVSDVQTGDLDGDGDNDLAVVQFGYDDGETRWIENKGNLSFEFHRICNFPGAFSDRPADVDQDGDTDILVVSGFNRWDEDGAESVIWLENDGKSNFVEHKVAEKPTHLITMEVSDFDNDGKPDMVTGGMHVYPPFDKMGRVTLWMNVAQ